MGFSPRMRKACFFIQQKGGNNVKTLHTMKRMLVALLSASMLLTSSALAAGGDSGTSRAD